MNKNYQIGQEVFYHDGMCVLLVEILDNEECSELIERYSLKVKEVISFKPSFTVTEPRKVGEEFECQKLRQSETRGLWRLVERLEDTKPKVAKGTTVDEARRSTSLDKTEDVTTTKILSEEQEKS